VHYRTSANEAGEVKYGFTQTINGRGETSERSFGVINPATEALFAQSPDASRQQLDHAVAAARRAFRDWSRLSFGERHDYLVRFAMKIGERSQEIAALITREQGKPIGASKHEMAMTVHSLHEMSLIEVKDQVLRDDGKNRISLHFKPIGVVGGITPWNVPVGLASHKIAQALYTGNTLVLKPSPYTPLSTLLIGEISRDVLPPGVFNVVAGGNDLGQWMTEHPDIDKITFTGSVATGKRIMASAAGTLKRVTLELGGNDPAIILDDADLAATAPKVFGGAFILSGQVCMAIKRLYVPEKMYDRVCETLTTMANNHRVGEGFEPDVQMGPLQNKMQYDKVTNLLEDTKRQPGVSILAGGNTLNRRGYFVQPTIVADIADNTRLVTEEQFGPVLPVLRYKTVDEAIERANATRMGLCASVWTSDIKKGGEIASKIEAGTVWVNHHVGSHSDIPFGGFKESGVGREHGLMGLQAYMEPQVINVPVQ
jgi:acyl-CoA reductase-like NAD-dependent aldehyde dehydrogenase